MLNKILQIFRLSRRIFWNAEKPGKTEKSVRFNSVRIQEPDSDGFRLLHPLGKIHNDRGPYNFNAEQAQQVIDNINIYGPPMVDLEHHSMKNDGTFFDDTGATAWGSKEPEDYQVRDDGLYWRNHQFVDPAVGEKVKNGLYKFFSPVINLDKKINGHSVGCFLDSVALTNRPNFRGPIAAHANTETVSEDKMKPEELKKYRELYGLDENADESAILAAIHADPSKLPKADAGDGGDGGGSNNDGKDGKEADGGDAGDDKNVKPNTEEMPAWAKQMQDDIKSMKANTEAASAATLKANSEQIVDAAIGAGKLRPVDRDIYVNAAIADFDGTKKKLDGLKANSVLPGKTTMPEATAEDGKPLTGQKLSTAFQEQMRGVMASGRRA